MNDPESLSEPKDHRVLSGERKRARMREHLLHSILLSYPGENPATPAVIDDVIRQAGVSRGTFYKYFSSLEDAVEELATRLADELTHSYSVLYKMVSDPKIRAATGFQLFLSRAAIEPAWGSFISHLNHLSRDTDLAAQIGKDLEAGLAAGVFRIREVEAAVDLVIGATIESVRRLVAGSGSRYYIETMASMILQSLGVAPEDADESAAIAAMRLHRDAPAHLSWWKPFS